MVDNIRRILFIISYLKEQGILVDKIVKYNLLEDEDEIILFITMKDTNCVCNYCKSNRVVIKEYKTKTIHGLNVGERKCLIEIKFNRMLCKSCNKTFTPHFMAKQNKFSPSLIKKVLKLCQKIISYKDIAEELNISVTSVINIFDANVPNLRQPIGDAICIDEFKNVKDPDNKYACVFLDFQTGKIIHILKNRTIEYLRVFLKKQPKNQLNGVKFFICDMYDGYITIAKEFFPNAKIAIDPFHYMGYFTDAIQDIRIRLCGKDVNEKPMNSSRINKNWKLLTHNYSKKEIRYVNNEDGTVTDLYEVTYENIKHIDELRHSFLMLQDFYSEEEYPPTSIEEARTLISFTIFKMLNSEIKELIECAQTRSHYQEYISNSFYKINGRRISNGPIEGTNSRTKTIKKVHCGYSNQERFYERVIYIINSKR